MKKIALISDNHSYYGEEVRKITDECDEVWHAGDIGSFESIEKLRADKLFRAVYGNIDDYKIRAEFPEYLVFFCEELKVLMTHIGGYPGKYSPGVRTLLKEHQPQLFICGHSHILKVMRDPVYNLIHMNPGAYGVHGFHQFRTMLTFCIAGADIHEVKVIEFGRRGAMK